MSDSMESVNPLMQIDTGFRSYLNAYTRSFQNHVVDGQLDYAFDSDFAVRQKITGLTGWSKLAKAVNSADISAEAKHLFMKCNQAGALKYPELYDIVKVCAERLELNLPIVFVREDIDKPLIYSVASDIIEPCIVMTQKLLELCTEEELQLLIGCEAGRIQNNHAVYNWAFTYLNYNRNVYKPAERSYKQSVSNQIVCSLIEWVKYADITADRAGIICIDRPGRFLDIFCGLYKKGYIDFYGRSGKDLDFGKLSGLHGDNHTTAARSLKSDGSLSELERRLLASAEFLSCDSLFAWRRDIDKSDIHTISGQICDVRSSIILGTGGQ
ncbi:M48 family metalloprotease [Ruminococcus sp. Marseille-P6503]|uniref:M48 family metalloprotease n=1 Tax=Ruminococcus sp. Marseille-P6503 TaxID=2364796 RepID=UPI000F547316|nr:M48 family metalloprotease [Ruminococcus sp. Marseille-P6503]